jgi:hypothetical protein
VRNVAGVLTALAVACAVWATIAAVRMTAWLSRHGVDVDWLWFRALIPWYVHRYRTMHEGAGGRPDPLYAQFVVTINLALVLALAAVMARLAAR